MNVGVLAVQGAYAAHIARLESLGVVARPVRRAHELDGLEGLILPGGESTTMLHHLEREGMVEALAAFIKTRPCFGTCAGAILLADTVVPDQRSFQALPIAVVRNAYGRQAASTVVEGASLLGDTPLEMVFIRAPRITAVGEDVDVLARRDDDPVLVRWKHLLACTFHPELSDDARVHTLFLDMVAHARQS